MSNYFETDLFKYVVLPVIYIAIGYLFHKVLKIAIARIFDSHKIKGKDKKRVDTTRILIQNFLKYIIMIVVLLFILNAYSIDVKSILAGLGIGVAVVGLAFQDILKDILAGISILLENQFEVGDDIEVDGFRGQVIFIGLKTTRIKNYKGAVKIISNRNITQVINYSLNPALAILELPIRYESDLDQVEKALLKISKTIEKTCNKLKGPIEIWGVDQLGDSSVVYKIAVLTIPGEQFNVERLLKKEFKQGLEKNGFSIPYPQLEVHYERENV